MTTQTPFPQFPPAFLARFADEVLSAVSLQPMAADGIARLQQLASTAVLVQRLAVLLQGTQLPARQSVALDTAMHRALEKSEPVMRMRGAPSRPSCMALTCGWTPRY